MSTRFRRKAREVALQVLFQRSFHEEERIQTLFEAFSKNFPFDQNTLEYALFIVNSVVNDEKRINEMIVEKSKNWSLDRITMIDKILLQIGILELCFSETEQNLPKLVINDIIDLAKKYSSEDSKRFINGILDSVYNQFFNKDV